MRKAVEDISKLPKWAQSEIKVLRMRNEEMEKKLDVYGEKVKTRISYGRGIQPNKYLPEYSRVSFNLGQDTGRIFEIDCFIREDNVLEIMASGGAISVKPWAANAIKVTIDK